MGIQVQLSDKPAHGEQGKNLEDIGGFSEAIKRTVGQRLRQGGVPILTQDKNPPTLRIDIFASGDGRHCSVSLSLRETVRLERDTGIQVLDATVWQTLSLGDLGDLENLPNEIERLTDEFCRAYQKANPKK